MAGETREGAADSSGPGQLGQAAAVLERLDQVVAVLERIAGRADQLAALLEKYGPALDKAARLAESPAGRAAAAVGSISRPWRH